MGADGHIVIVRRDEFEANRPGVEPSDLGLYTGTVLGTEAVWGYYGDNLFDPNYGRGYFRTWEVDASPEQLAAADWFEGHAESHEVWT